jgi:hypothetical protein
MASTWRLTAKIATGCILTDAMDQVSATWRRTLYRASISTGRLPAVSCCTGVGDRLHQSCSSRIPDRTKRCDAAVFSLGQFISASYEVLGAP